MVMELGGDGADTKKKPAWNMKGKNPTSLEQESFPPECCSLEAVDIPSNTLSLGCNTWILDSRIRNYRKERSESE